METYTRREALKEGGRLFLGAAAGTLLGGQLSGCSSQEPGRDLVAALVKKVTAADADGIQLTIVYDNIRYDNTLQTDWGFGCLVEGLDRTILFDTGRYDGILFSNLASLGIDPQRIDQLFLSHDHPDHVGGAQKFLDTGDPIDVALVSSFPSSAKAAAAKTGGAVLEIDQPAMVTRNCLSTGEMKSIVSNEHSLVVPTDKGTIVVTGCAHPGVVEIVRRAMQITQQEILLVAGGFHLMSDFETDIREKSQLLQEMGVRYVAPSHCSGGEALKGFADRFGDRFIASGVGRKIAVGDLAAA